MHWMRTFVIFVVAATFLSAGCKRDDGVSDDDDDGTPTPGDPSEYTGGDFQFTTLAVDDGCLDGALEVLFMPNGPEVPRNWDYATYLPSFDEMPTTYSIDLRAPFIGIQITVEDAGDYRMTVDDAVMSDVLLDEERYGDCTVTMTCDVDLTVVDSLHVEGTTAISMSDGVDEHCPVFTTDPCTMTLTLVAEKI